MNKFDFIEVYISIFKEELEKAYKSNAENGIYDEFDIEFIKEKLEALKQIKEDLKVLEITAELIKNNYDYNLLSKEDRLKLYNFIKINSLEGDSND